MMLRPFAVIGLATLTATATMASVNDGRHDTGAIPADTVVPDLGWPVELPEIDIEGGKRLLARQKAARPAVIQPKTPSEKLRLPMGSDGSFVGTGRVLVKFANQARVRAELFPSNQVVSAVGADVTPITSLLERYDATIQQLIHKSPAMLEKLQQRIVERSNREQPDFAAFTAISFPNGIDGDDLLALGRGLNDLDLTEWVQFETPIAPASQRFGGTGNPATDTPDFTSASWLTAPIDTTALDGWKENGTGIPPTEVFNFPPYTYQNEVLQQHQIGAAPFLGLQPVAEPDDPTTWFRESQWLGAEGYNLPAMIRIAGQTWRRYGSPPIGPDGSVRDVFNVGDGPNAGFLGTLPEPRKVWMYGAEFEIIDATQCDDPDYTDYDCADCYDIVPVQDGNPDAPLKDAFNPFPEFATDLLNLDVYANIKLCPTGRKTEIGMIDVAAFRYHEEFLYDRYGDFIETADRNVIFEEGQTMVLIENGATNELLRSNASHGTAAAGVLVAGNNNFGMTGMTWASTVRFYPTISSEEGARVASAIVSAIADLEPGSILCCPIQTTLGEGDPPIGTGTFVLPGAAGLGNFLPFGPSAIATQGCQHLSSFAVYAQLLGAARDAGIVVIQAAGNGTAPCGTDAGGEEAEAVGITVTAATPSDAASELDPQTCADFFQLPDPWPDGQPCGYYGLSWMGDPDDEEFPFPTNLTSWPTRGQTRWSGSNWFNSDGENPILDTTVSGWGMAIPTLGYGDFYRNQVPPDLPSGDGSQPPEVVDPLERYFLRSYTGPRPSAATYYPSGELPAGCVNDDETFINPYCFGDAGAGPPNLAFPNGVPFNHNGMLFQGTSAASTQIAGLAVWLQGFGQMFYGTNLSTEQLAGAMGAGVLTNDAELNPNAMDNDPTGINPDAVDAGGVNNWAPGVEALVPSVPNGPRAVISVLQQIGLGFAGDLEIYTGQRIRGNKFSLSQDDGNVLAIRSEPVNMGQTMEGITYLVTGNTVDIGLDFTSEEDALEVITMQLTVLRRTTRPGIVEVAYAKNFENGRYVPFGLDIVPNVETEWQPALGQGATSVVSSFVANDSNAVDIRLYSFGFGFVGDSNFIMEYEEIILEVNGDNAPL